MEGVWKTKTLEHYLDLPAQCVGLRNVGAGRQHQKAASGPSGVGSKGVSIRVRKVKLMVVGVF